MSIRIFILVKVYSIPNVSIDSHAKSDIVRAMLERKLYFGPETQVAVPSVRKDSPSSEIIFSKLANQLNQGMSFAELDIAHPDLYLTSLAATAIAAHVAQERESGNTGPFTMVERAILSNWRANRERELRNEPEQSLPLKLAEFAGATILIEEAIHRSIKALRDRVSLNLPDNPVVDGLIASVVARKVPELLHNNALALEKFVAINATAVDPEGLMTELGRFDNPSPRR